MYPPRALPSTTASTEKEPTCFIIVAKHPEWRHAINDEFDAFLRNGTWALVPATPQMNVIGCKWVYRLKRNVNGTIQCHKAQLVANGFHQQPSLDYGETFSSVVKPQIIQLILSLAVTQKWPMPQLDLKNAFLHDDLME